MPHAPALLRVGHAASLPYRTRRPHTIRESWPLPRPIAHPQQLHAPVIPSLPTMSEQAASVPHSVAAPLRPTAAAYAPGSCPASPVAATTSSRKGSELSAL